MIYWKIFFTNRKTQILIGLSAILLAGQVFNWHPQEYYSLMFEWIFVFFLNIIVLANQSINYPLYHGLFPFVRIRNAEQAEMRLLAADAKVILVYWIINAAVPGAILILQGYLGCKEWSTISLMMLIWMWFYTVTKHLLYILGLQYHYAAFAVGAFTVLMQQLNDNFNNYRNVWCLAIALLITAPELVIIRSGAAGRAKQAEEIQ